MNRKMIIPSIVILLCCSSSDVLNASSYDSNRFLLMGYSNDEAQMIENFSSKNKELFIAYNKDLSEIINMPNFKEEYLSYYITNNYDIDTFKYIIKNNLFSDKAKLETINSICSDELYIFDNIEKYLEYKDKFNSNRLLIEYVNTKAYLTPFDDAITSDDTKGIYIMASKLYYLGDFTPENLVEVEEGYYILSKPYLQDIAWEAYKKMSDDAKKEGLDFYISTAYRSSNFQSTLYNGYLQVDTIDVTDTYSSRPGYSDHQTGLACDVRTKTKTFNNFTDTKEAEWLKYNCYKYGFIIRYPEGKQDITGYIPESWHLRYVGEDAASYITLNNITFDEYYAYFIEREQK